MYCPNCGNQNDDQSVMCANCGTQLGKTEPEKREVKENVPNYLVQAILVTIFCCLPFGIPAIVFAAQVNGRLESGDYEGAVRASKQAKTWCWVSFGVGIAAVLVWILMFAVNFFVAMSSY